MKDRNEEEFRLTPDGVVHIATEASFTANPGMPTHGFWRDGLLGTEGCEFNAEEVKARMRKLWAAYLLDQR